MRVVVVLVVGNSASCGAWVGSGALREVAAEDVGVDVATAGRGRGGVLGALAWVLTGVLGAVRAAELALPSPCFVLCVLWPLG